MMDKRHYDQLRQIFMAKEVWAGNLADKEATRDLIRSGHVHNTGGAPSSIDRVSLTAKGRRAIETGINEHD